MLTGPTPWVVSPNPQSKQTTGHLVLRLLFLDEWALLVLSIVVVRERSMTRVESDLTHTPIPISCSVHVVLGRTCPLLERLFPLLLKMAWTLDVVLGTTESNLCSHLENPASADTTAEYALFFGFLWGKTCDFTEW